MTFFSYTKHFRYVYSRVLRLICQYLNVVWMVVSLIAIDVMDDFTGAQGAPELLLGNLSMKKARRPDSFVTAL